MTYQRLFNQNKTTDAICGTGTAYPVGTSAFKGVRVAQSLYIFV
jgi:hypothetical protein